MELLEHGLYIVKEQYFTDFPSKHWMQNKSESRPHYYSFVDPKGVIWMIPMSSQIENYKAKIKKEEQKRNGRCLFYHIGKIAGKERVFIISDLFPITEDYIARAYTISSVEYVVRNETLNRELRSKAVKYIRLLEQKKLIDRNHILKIRSQLIK